MTSMQHRWSVAALALACASGCFNPKFKDAIACGPGGECPPGQSCGVDLKCHEPIAPVVDSPPGTPDGTLDASPDARADAMPVGCQGDGDCQTPPDMCSLPGTCDLSNHVCSFPALDCTGVGDECNVGGCDPTAGCIKVAAHQGDTCGPGNQCAGFGACSGFSGTCDSTGMYARACTLFTCQTGACTGNNYTDTEACTVSTEGVTCGTTSVTGCGGCGSNTLCSTDGTMTCTCTAMKCMGDGCTPIPTSCTQACTLVTDGDDCGTTHSGCPPNEIRDLCCLNGKCSNPCSSCAQ